MEFELDAELADEHRRWLSGFHPQHLRNWQKLVKADAEAAACEAKVRRMLHAQGNRIEPNEDLRGTRPTPDFRCQQSGRMFFVEVTCISIAKATEITGLSHPLQKGFVNFANLNDALYRAVKEKTPQCSGLNVPALVAIGTFHFQASCLCFKEQHMAALLTGKELVTQQIDAANGDPVGRPYLSTKLQAAAFLRPSADLGMGEARQPVSGLLLCGFGCEPPEIRAVLHPHPLHDFNRDMLPDIPFCQLKREYASGALTTEWV